MGKRNKQRRAAKARKRARRNGGVGDSNRSTGQKRPSSGGPDHRDTPGKAGGRRPGGRSAPDSGPGAFEEPPSEREQVADLIEANQLARDLGDPAVIAEILTHLLRCSPHLVADHLERAIAAGITSAWARGWLPAELTRQVRRSTSVNGERLAAFAVAVDHRDREPATLHPTWRQHLGALALPAVGRRQGWLRSGELAGSFTTVPDWPDLVDLASAVLFQLSVLRRLQEIVPPPGSPAVDVEHSIIGLAAEGSSPMLAKVRHLLAQAESTTFDAEAEAFTAKAQELMARHAIDAAMVWDRNEREGSPTTIRIPIDDPYWNAKGLLLALVAEESRCRAVLDSGYAMASLVGFESDLVWCETLFTSLLVQAQHELGRAGAADHAGGRRRSRSFRSSFLVAYAHRIGDRLAEVNAHVQQATVDGDSDGELSSLLPVLASRRAAIDDAVDAQFGQLSTMSIRGGSDPLGWNAGRAAAERARLTRGDLESREAS